MPRIGPLVAPPPVAPPAPSPATPGAGDSPFAHRLRAAPGSAFGPPDVAPGPLGAPGPDLSTQLTALLSEVRRDERRLDRYVRRALSGAHFELSELVAMQTLVHRYTRKVELLSKLVDRVSGAVKQTLQTQL